MPKRRRMRMAIITTIIMVTTMRTLTRIMNMALNAAAVMIMRMTTRTITTTMLTTTITDMPTSARETGNGVLPLLAWLSPAFPVGSFAYSHGLEWAFEARDVTDARSTQGWITDLVECGGPWSDAVLLAAAHRAVDGKDFTTLKDVSAFAAALAPSRERRLETMAQGEAFMYTVAAAWSCKAFDKAAGAIGREVAYPVAIGLASASHEIPLRLTLESYLLAVVANLVSAAVRLIPLGQTDGTRIVASLTPLVREVAERAERSTLDDVGGAAIRSDIASMKHETQYSRLFRS